MGRKKYKENVDKWRQPCISTIRKPTGLKYHQIENGPFCPSNLIKLHKRIIYYKIKIPNKMKENIDKLNFTVNFINNTRASHGYEG